MPGKNKKGKESPMPENDFRLFIRILRRAACKRQDGREEKNRFALIGLF